MAPCHGLSPACARRPMSTDHSQSSPGGNCAAMQAIRNRTGKLTTKRTMTDTGAATFSRLVFHTPNRAASLPFPASLAITPSSPISTAPSPRPKQTLPQHLTFTRWTHGLTTARYTPMLQMRRKIRSDNTSPTERPTNHIVVGPRCHKTRTRRTRSSAGAAHPLSRSGDAWLRRGVDGHSGSGYARRPGIRQVLRELPWEISCLPWRAGSSVPDAAGMGRADPAQNGPFGARQGAPTLRCEMRIEMPSFAISSVTRNHQKLLLRHPRRHRGRQGRGALFSRDVILSHLLQPMEYIGSLLRPSVLSHRTRGIILE